MEYAGSDELQRKGKGKGTDSINPAGSRVTDPPTIVAIPFSPLLAHRPHGLLLQPDGCHVRRGARRAPCSAEIPSLVAPSFGFSNQHQPHLLTITCSYIPLNALQ